MRMLIGWVEGKAVPLTLYQQYTCNKDSPVLSRLLEHTVQPTVWFTSPLAKAEVIATEKASQHLFRMVQTRENIAASFPPTSGRSDACFAMRVRAYVCTLSSHQQIEQHK